MDYKAKGNSLTAKELVRFLEQCDDKAKVYYVDFDARDYDEEEAFLVNELEINQNQILLSCSEEKDIIIATELKDFLKTLDGDMEVCWVDNYGDKIDIREVGQYNLSDIAPIGSPVAQIKWNEIWLQC